MKAAEQSTPLIGWSREGAGGLIQKKDVTARIERDERGQLRKDFDSEAEYDDEDVSLVSGNSSMNEFQAPQVRKRKSLRISGTLGESSKKS